MRFSQKWRNYREHLRFKYAPRIADWIVARSTYQARASLIELGHIKILVDNTVFHHAVTHETAWVSTGAQTWGPHVIDTGYQARIPVHNMNSRSREYRNIQYLPGISYLCQKNYIDLVTSAELEDEKFRQPIGRYRGYGQFDYSPFSDLNIQSIDGCVDRHIESNFPKERLFGETQRTRLEKYENDPKYKSLVRCLGKHNSQDAWHIYTADKFGLYCFLTMDFKLIQNIKSQSGNNSIRSLKTFVLTPQDFGERMKLIPIPPRILSYNDASFFVREDVTMPDGKRRPLKNYGSDIP